LTCGSSGTGAVIQTGGQITSMGTIAIGGGYSYCTGLWSMANGTVTNTGTLNIGGNVQPCMLCMTNGTWWQGNTMYVGGTASASGTGIVVISGGAFLAQTNVYVADHNNAYGLFSLSNATFQATNPGTVFTLGTSSATGIVTIAGTQTVFQVNQLTINARGSLTNYLAGYSGGVDITSTNALTINSTGTVSLVFQQNPVSNGIYWGVRWLGTNHIAALQAFTSSVPRKLTWTDSQLSASYQGKEAVYTDAVYTYFGIQATNVAQGQIIKAISNELCPLTVTVNGKGASSLGSGAYVSQVIALGTSTQIVYSAAEWNRISMLASNGVALPSAGGLKSFTQKLEKVCANISNAVTFAMATPVQTGYTNVPTAWLTNWTEAAVQAALGRDGFSMHDKYLLGLDPTSSNSYRLLFDALSVSGSNVVIVVRRDVAGALAPDGMHGNLVVQGAPALAGSDFTNIPGTVVTGSQAFDALGRRTFTNSVNGAARLFKATIQQ